VEGDKGNEFKVI